MSSGAKKTIYVFGHGLLDTLDDAFWMLPFSCRKQAELIRQEKNTLDEDWQKRRAQLSAEHKHADAHQQLMEGWKQWIDQESFAERRAQATANAPAPAPEDSEIPQFDE
jgi:hypothetical protein